MNLTREKAIIAFGEEVVNLAERYYETDFDKVFWQDLDDAEKREYLAKAKYTLESKQRSGPKLRVVE